MIRGDQRETRPRQLDSQDLDPTGIVDVIEVEDREEAGIRAAALEVVDGARRSSACG